MKIFFLLEQPADKQGTNTEIPYSLNPSFIDKSR